MAAYGSDGGGSWVEPLAMIEIGRMQIMNKKLINRVTTWPREYRATVPSALPIYPHFHAQVDPFVRQAMLGIACIGFLSLRE